MLTSRVLGGFDVASTVGIYSKELLFCFRNFLAVFSLMFKELLDCFKLRRHKPNLRTEFPLTHEQAPLFNVFETNSNWTAEVYIISKVR
jgi:hypothetical protein